MNLCCFSITFQSLYTFIKIFQIWWGKLFSGKDLIQNDICHCQVASVHLKNCPNLEYLVFTYDFRFKIGNFNLPKMLDCVRKFPVYSQLCFSEEFLNWYWGDIPLKKFRTVFLGHLKTIFDDVRTTEATFYRRPLCYIESTIAVALYSDTKCMTWIVFWTIL